jgi:hypothetical protein
MIGGIRMKALITLIVTLAFGVAVEATIGVAGNMPGIGAIVAVAVAAAFIVHFNEKRK